MELRNPSYLTKNTDIYLEGKVKITFLQNILCLFGIITIEERLNLIPRNQGPRMSHSKLTNDGVTMQSCNLTWFIAPVFAHILFLSWKYDNQICTALNVRYAIFNVYTILHTFYEGSIH